MPKLQLRFKYFRQLKQVVLEEVAELSLGINKRCPAQLTRYTGGWPVTHCARMCDVCRCSPPDTLTELPALG
jgi:hypothetical protein